MIRYGELSTKGKNKKYFIKKLMKNVKEKLKPFKDLKISSNRDRMYIVLNGEDSELVIKELKEVFGIQSFSPVVKVEKTLEQAKEAVVQLIGQHYFEGMSFKINTRRSDHEFEYDTNTSY